MIRINPESGELLRKVELPCVETTACAFGGLNLDLLFVTTGVRKTLVEENAGRYGWWMDWEFLEWKRSRMLDSTRSIPFQAPVDCIAKQLIEIRILKILRMTQ